MPSPRRSCVLVTRPAAQAAQWVQSLRERGIDAVAAPLIDIAGPTDPRPVDQLWAQLERFAMLVFVSPNAVSRFFARRPAQRRWPAALLAATPGPGSSATLREYGVSTGLLVEPAADAPSFDSVSLWEQLRSQPWHGRRVAIVRGDGGREWLAERLREAGAEVDFIAAYRRAAPRLDDDLRHTLLAALAAPEDRLWFFSSSEAIGNLLQFELLDAGAMAAVLARSAALATHPRIAERAREAGFGRVASSRPALDDVVACIQSSATLDFSSASRSSL